MSVGISTLIPLFAILLYAILIAFVSFSKPQTREKSTFRFYLVVMFIWSVTAYFVVIGAQDQTLWFRLMTASILLVPISVFHFVQISLSRPRKWAGWIYAILSVSVLLTILTPWVVKWTVVDAAGIHYEFDIGMYVIGLTAYVVYGMSMFDLASAFRKSDDPAYRTRLQYLMVGLGIIMLASMVNWTPLGKWPIDIAGNVVAALVLTYAVLRHKLLDIEVVIRKSLLYFIPTTIIGATYFLIITLVVRIFAVFSGAQIVLTSLLVAILSAIIVQPIRDKAQAWIDKMFFREKYDSNLMLQRVSRSAASFLEINTLANMILDEIVSTLHIDKAAFFLKENPFQDYRLVTHRNLGSYTNIRLKPEHPLVSRLNLSNQVITRRDIRLHPDLFPSDEQESDTLKGINAELYIPLKVQGNLIGILTVGEKKSEQPYSQDDQATVIALASQTAIAIENARLYKMEQTRRKEMDSLYTLSRELVATDDMATVLDKIVEHVLESIHVTFARILLRDEDNTYICKAIQPVAGLDYDLRYGKKDPGILYPYYEKILHGSSPVVLEAHKTNLTSEESSALFLEQVHSLCICPLRIGETPIGLLVLGERRHANREPFDVDKLRLASSIADQASSAIQRASLHDQLEENFFQTVIALAKAIDAKDSYTSDHSTRLVMLAVATAKRLGCSRDEINAISMAMSLHDIGKIGIPDTILQKPGKLTDEEWEQIKLHPEIGADILAPVKRLQNVAPIVRSHHERFDGKGYPDRLSGDAIPLGARILTLADSYGAITDDRVYRKARTHEEAVQEIRRCAGTQFDPFVTEAFLETVDLINEGKLILDLEDSTTQNNQ